MSALEVEDIPDPSLLLSFLVSQEDWMERGICHVEGIDTAVFILEKGHTAAEARTYCNRCDVVFECRNYARQSNSVGVWGGKVFSFKAEIPDLTPQQINDMRPIIKKVVFFESGEVPGIFGGDVGSVKPGIFG